MEVGQFMFLLVRLTRVFTLAGGTYRGSQVSL